jgi:hypothetical protein
LVSSFIAYRDKLSVSLCVFVRRFIEQLRSGANSLATRQVYRADLRPDTLLRMMGIPLDGTAYMFGDNQCYYSVDYSTLFCRSVTMLWLPPRT